MKALRNTGQRSFNYQKKQVVDFHSLTLYQFDGKKNKKKPLFKLIN